MGDPINRVNLLYSISETGFTGLIEPQKWVRSILIRSTAVTERLLPPRRREGAPPRAPFFLVFWTKTATAPAWT